MDEGIKQQWVTLLKDDIFHPDLIAGGQFCALGVMTTLINLEEEIPVRKHRIRHFFREIGERLDPRNYSYKSWE